MMKDVEDFVRCVKSNVSVVSKIVGEQNVFTPFMLHAQHVKWGGGGGGGGGGQAFET